MSLKQWFKNLFKKKEESVPGGYGNGSRVNHWGVIIPHELKAPGANSPMGLSEYHFALKMVQTMSFPYRTRDGVGVYGAAKALKGIACNASIEPHLNAYNGKASGFEILVLKDDTDSISMARLIAEEFARQFPGRKMRADNGIKLVTSKDRGGANLVAAKNAGMKIALLSEAFFIDNPDDYISPEKMAEFWNSVLR